MRQHCEKRVLPYTPAQLFALVADIQQYPVFLPWCQKASIIRQDDMTLKAVLQVGYKTFHDTFTSFVRFDPSHAINVEYAGGPLKQLKNEWRFDPAPGDSCEITFFVAYDFKSLLFGRMMDAFFDIAFCRMVAAFEERAIQLYGKKPLS